MIFTTMEEKPDHKSALFQIFAVLSVSYLCISCGTFLGFTSSAVESIKHDSNFELLSDDDISWIGSLGPLGALCGSLLTTILVKYLGVRGTMLYFSLPAFIVSWTTIALSTSIPCIFFGRFAGGIGTGTAISSAPMYVISIVDIAKRGKLGVAPQFLMLFGILASYSIGSLVSWNQHALACLFITVPSAVFLYFAPDTPRWLILKNKQDEALTLLERLHGKADGLKEYNRLMSCTTTSTNVNTKSKRSLLNSETIKPIILSLGLMTFQQFTGINGVTFYSVSIFQHSSGISKIGGPNLPTIVLALVQCIASLSSTLLIDRLGRKVLLVISSLIVGIASTIMGAYFYVTINSYEAEANNYEHLFWIPLAVLVLFAFGFAIGFGPVPYLYVTEILPEEIRTIFNPIVIGYTWGCVFAVTKSFPYIKTWISLCGVFWLYASFSIAAFFFIIICLPETKGKSLEEVRLYFKNGKNCTNNNNNDDNVKSMDKV